MHIFFSGIGGTGVGPLALIARQAGFEVSGSDKQTSKYIAYLQQKGLKHITIGQSWDDIAAVHNSQPIDWLVYTSALPIENPDAPELLFCRQNGIKSTKRDEFLNFFLEQKNLRMIAVAGTHGKTTATAMTIWACKKINLPVSYSVGAKLTFGEMGEFDPGSRYFVYEADEFDRNFLSFRPRLSVITGIDWDHPDIYPTRASYRRAFLEFCNQSERLVIWDGDEKLLGPELKTLRTVLSKNDRAQLGLVTLPGRVNRENALQVAAGVEIITGKDRREIIRHLNEFPGVSRRFEKLAAGLYTDYAHTPPKIRGSLQLAREVAGQDVVVVYEGLHNTRQHFIKDELAHLFDGVKKLYIVPSYLAREDKTLPLLTPEILRGLLSPAARKHAEQAGLNGELLQSIRTHLSRGDLVLCLSAGGANSLDEWLRKEFS